MRIKKTLDIPNELIKDLGKIDISNVAVRSKETGRIIKYIKLNSESELEKAQEIAKSIKNKNLIIGIGVTAAVATIGGIISLIINKSSEKNSVEIPKCINDFQKNFHKYLNETQKGILNVKTIDKLINSLNEIEKIKEKEIKIDFSAKELKFILNKIYDFTNSMNKEQKYFQEKFKAPTNNSSKNIVYLKDYLQFQKQVAERAS